jgi:hypothetical protein
MSYPMNRESYLLGPWTITSNASTTIRIPYVQYSGGMYFYAGMTAGDVNWCVAEELSGGPAPVQARDSSGAIIKTTLPTGSGAAEIPSALFGAMFLVPVMATANNTCTIKVMVKT